MSKILRETKVFDQNTREYVIVREVESEQVQIVQRLSPEVYAHLVKKLNTNNCQVVSDTSVLQAGFIIGVQHVLQVLRETGIAYASGNQ